MEYARVQERGQVTVPKAIRDRYNIGCGTTLEFIPLGEDTFECRVVPRATDLLERFSVDAMTPDLDALRPSIESLMAADALRSLERT
jgi:AbrB family looped-hinge helix DNA binding protein